MKSDHAPNADLYQLLAYTIATKLSIGLLIYAAGETEEIAHHIKTAEKTLQVRTLDLADSPKAILDQIETLARLIRSMANVGTLSPPLQQTG
jgi:5-methylcytosine-specific restriction endonuclease McrBC regulatory subunit McrC